MPKTETLNLQSYLQHNETKKWRFKQNMSDLFLTSISYATYYLLNITSELGNPLIINGEI